MTEITPEAVKAARDAATPGPWAVDIPHHHPGMREVIGPAMRCVGFTIATDVSPEKARTVVADARLIAMAPCMADLIETQAAELAEAKAEIERLQERVKAADLLAYAGSTLALRLYHVVGREQILRRWDQVFAEYEAAYRATEGGE